MSAFWDGLPSPCLRLLVAPTRQRCWAPSVKFASRRMPSVLVARMVRTDMPIFFKSTHRANNFITGASVTLSSVGWSIMTDEIQEAHLRNSAIFSSSTVLQARRRRS